MVCQCSGTGVPFPSVFWTKQPNTTIIGTGNTYERDLISRNVDGKYNCHLKNLLKEVISTTGFYHYGKSLIFITDNKIKPKCSLLLKTLANHDPLRAEESETQDKQNLHRNYFHIMIRFILGLQAMLMNDNKSFRRTKRILIAHKDATLLFFVF